MPFDFSIPFHESSKDLRRFGARIPADPKDWPCEWKTTVYKDYGKLPTISLQKNNENDRFFSLVKERVSTHRFSEAGVSMNELSSLLASACGELPGKYGDARHRRVYPSAGALYPIEVYPLILRSSLGLPSGVYHYNVRTHSLDVLWERSFQSEDVAELFAYDWVHHVPVALILTAVFKRTKQKYGDRGYRGALIEAGHIGQNVYLASAALGLKCCGLAGTRDQALERLLDIDGITESVTYALVVGK